MPPTPTAATDIADATIRVIVNRGFDAVSIRTVAAEAGVAAGTVQYHMKSRDYLLLQAFERSIERQKIRAANMAPSDSVIERHVAALMELLPTGTVQREDAAMWVIYGSAAYTRAELSQRYVEELTLFQDTVAHVIRLAAERGEVSNTIDPPSTARLVTALVNGLTLDYLNISHPSVEQLSADLKAGLSSILHTDASRHS